MINIASKMKPPTEPRIIGTLLAVDDFLLVGPIDVGMGLGDAGGILTEVVGRGLAAVGETV